MCNLGEKDRVSRILNLLSAAVGVLAASVDGHSEAVFWVGWPSSVGQPLGLAEPIVA